MRRSASFALSIGLAFSSATALAAPASLSLSEAYQAALSFAERVQIAEGNRELADTTYTGQLAIMGPTILAQAKGTRENTVKAENLPGLPEGSGLQPPFQTSLGALLTQPLFRRQIFDARRAARLGIEGAEQALVRAKQQLMYDVATVFIAVLQGRTQVLIAEGAVRRAESQLTSANNKFKAGGALQTAVLLAQIELNRAQTSVNTAEGALRTQQSSFERVVGQPPPEVLTLPPTPSQPALREAMTHAPNERADLRQLHLATQQARVTVNALQDLIFWPTLDLNLFAGYYSAAASTGPAIFNFPSYSIGGTFTVPIFQTGNEWLQVKLQKERVFIAAYNESLLRRQVGDDVRQALARLETANKAIEIATEQQKTAEKNYQLVSTQYKLGAATALDVLTAQGAVFEAETNKAQSQYEREIASYQLLFAEGKIQL